jgi:hypothetical protein
MMIEDIEALRTKLFESVGMAYPAMTIVTDNQPEDDVSSDEIWCRFVVRPGTKQVAEGGDTKRYYQFGIATLQIMVPKSTGDGAGYDVADECDHAFRDWRTDDKALTVYQTGYQVFPSRDDDPFFTINFQILYRSLRA